MRYLSKIFSKKTRYSARLGLALLALFFCTLNSCNNYPDPSIETINNYSVSYTGNNQTAIGGEYLKDSICVYVQRYNSQQNNSGFSIEFNVKKGGGKVDQQVVKTKLNGKAATRWKLGTDSFTQIVSFKVTDPDGNVLPETQIIAHGILYNAWNEIDYWPLSQFSDMAADTISQQSWLISANNLYKRGSNFLDWQQIYTPSFNGAREIEIDKDGVIYVGTWYGEMYKSKDHGQTWTKCTNPIPDHPYYSYFWITSDGDLWATHPDRGTWHTKDGGMTWSSIGSVYITGAFRLKNGWLLSLIAPTGQRLGIMKSEDDGKTWTALTTPDYPYSFFVTENDEIIVFTQSNAGIFKSTNLGKTYRQVHSGSVAFNTGSMQNYVKKFGLDYYMVIPGYGVLKTQDFEKFETLLNEPNINGIGIDHTGSIAVMGWFNSLNRSFFYGSN